MFQRVLLIAAAAALLTRPSWADEPTTLPPDLAAVPGNAIAFVHVRVADLWQSDALKELRASVMRAGPKALQAFDDRFVPAPSTIDRLTLIVLDPREVQQEPPIIGLLACSKPFDRAKVFASLLPMGKEMKVGGATIVADAELNLAARIIDDRTLAIAPVAVLEAYLKNSHKGANPLAAALRHAAGGHHVVAAVNVSLIPGEAIAELPEPLQPLLRARVGFASLDIGSELRAEVRLQYADEAQARSGEAAGREGVRMAREALKGLRAQMEEQLKPKKKGTAPISELPEAALAVAALGAIEQADEYLKDLPLKRDGSLLAASIAVPAGPYTSLLGLSGLSAGLALPAVQKVRMAATRSQSANNMKQILLAFHNYAATFNDGLPPAAICDKNGKPLLSWRVAILPYIEQDNLYRQFHLDEPWDSEHNKKFIALMPRTYALPTVTRPGETTTYYRVFHGNGAGLELKKGVKFTDFTDGTSNTLVLVEAADPVVWTKPDDFPYDPNKPLPKLGRLSPDGFWIGMADGSVRFVSRSITETMLRAVITRAGGEVINIP